MRKLLISIALLLCTQLYTFGQNSTVDSLISQIDSTPRKDLGQLLNTIGINFMDFNNYEKAFLYADSARKIGIEDDDIRLIINSKITLAKTMARAENYLESMRYAYSAFQFDIKDSPADSSPVYAVMGEVLERIGAIDQALHFQLEHFRFTLASGHPQNRFYVSGSVANLYMKQNKYDSAVYFFKQSIFTENIIGSPYFLLHSYNNIGLSFYHGGKLDSALTYYQKGMAAFIAAPVKNKVDSLMYGYIHGNTAMIHEKRKNYSTAIDFMTVDFTMSQKCGSKREVFNNATVLVRLNLAHENLPLAKKYLAKAEELNPSSFNWDTQSKYEWIKAQFYILSKNQNKAIFHLKKYEQLQDSITDHEMEITIKAKEALALFQLSNIQTELRLQKAITDQDKAQRKFETKQEANRRVILYCLLGLALVFIFIIRAFYKKRVENQKKSKELLRIKKELAELQQEKLEAELKSKKKDLSKFALDIARKHEFTEEMLGELQEVKIANGLEQEQLLKDLIINTKGHLNLDDTLKVFHEHIDVINAAFFEKLVTDFPGLTQYE
ncbi:MAG: hypothetical protein JKY54_13810 [Flavobacteriales bacterium]|nr:hypothetical protein [Flavobacteriales bacterium]